MPLYRAAHRYSNAVIALEPGTVAGFSVDETKALNTDSPGLLAPITYAEIRKLTAAIDKAWVESGLNFNVDFAPPAPVSSKVRGHGPVHVAGVATQTGLTRR